MASRSPLSLGFKDFESALSTRGLAPTTQAAYLRGWKLLLGTCAVAGVEVGAVTPEQARGWWAAWTAGKGSSAHLQLKAGLGAGYRILGLSNPFESCEAAQIADRKIRYLTPQEVGQVLARLAENRTDYLAALLYALSFTPIPENATATW